jgi:8-oxo-dGTP pyrophosphatase MutT (NUDIX family)
MAGIQGGRMARIRQQAAVIPYRIRNARVEVAIVSTWDGRGWIVPKGSVDAGERPRDTAIREAREEAGLQGIVTRKPLGRYRHVKGDDPYHVDVYLMRVTTVLERWLEDGHRRRRWMRAGDAAARLRHELQPFIHDLDRGIAVR